jgi:hypothetical protein
MPREEKPENPMKTTCRIMLSTGCILLSALAVGSAPALSDPAAIANAVSARFDKAFPACDIPAVMELYEDNATAIYEPNMAVGKPAIEKMAASYCKDGRSDVPPYKQTGAHAYALGRDYIILVRMLDFVDKNGKPGRVCATELVHQSGGKWRYLVDHAGFCAPPIAGSAARPAH